MESSPPDLGRQTVDDGAHADSLAQPNLQILAGSNSCNIGSFSANVVGRDLIQNITNFNTSPPAGGRVSIQTQRETILKRLSAPTFHAVYASALEQRMAQTGSWFLELPDFQEFMGSKGVTLWCTGMPGAGKTILASIAVERLCKAAKETPCIALAFAFLRYSERYTWREILVSLLIQLIEGNDISCATFWPHYSPAAAKATAEPVILQSELEITLCDIASKLEKLYVVIDGLDEAIDEVKDRLLETLVPSGVNLLILSRPLDLYTHHALDALFVSIQAETKDIELYVRGEVKRSSRLKTIFQGRPEKISELCEKINQQSKGMFLVARLQMETITRSSNSIASLFRNLQALPAGVDDMYDLTLSRIRDSEDSSLAFRALAWMVYHNDGGDIDLSILQPALSFNLETQTFDADDITPVPLILSACQGLITHIPTGWGGTVQFIHYTTYEYMKSTELDIIGHPNPHSLLALTCLTCMEDHREDLLSICRGDQSRLHYYLDEEPLLRYSHMSWSEHATLSQSPDSVFPHIHPFLLKHEEHPLFITGHIYLGMEILSGANLVVMHNLTETGRHHLQNDQGLLAHTKSEPSGYTPFHIAAMRGQFETFRILLSSRTGVNVRSHDGRTVLHVAVQCRQTSFVQQLYDLATNSLGEDLGLEVFDWNVNAQDSRGETPLILAIEARDQGLVEMLSSCVGVDYSIQDDGGTSPFMSVCHLGLEDTVKHILAQCEGDSTLVHQTNKQGKTALMKVCGVLGKMPEGNHGLRRPLMAILDILVAHGGDLHARDVEGMTPFLHIIKQHTEEPLFYYPPEKSETDIPEVMERIITLDPTLIDHCDYRGRTALTIAARGDRRCMPAMHWILERKGGDVDYINARDKDGKTALLHALQSGNGKAVVALLALPTICPPDISAIESLFLVHDHIEEVWLKRVALSVKAVGWDPSLVRKLILRRASGKLDSVMSYCFSPNFRAFWAFTREAFTWNLDDIDTVVLLASASRKPCPRLVALILVSLGLLHPPLENERTNPCEYCHGYRYTEEFIRSSNRESWY